MKRVVTLLSAVVVVGLLAFLLLKDRTDTPSLSGVSQDQTKLSTEIARKNAVQAIPVPSIRTGSRPHATEQLRLPPGNVKSYLSDLIGRATATPPSPQAAYLLYAALNACRTMATWSAQELVAAKAAAGNDPLIQPPDCSGVTAEDLAQADRWLKTAADQGFANAQIEYARRYVTNFQDLEKVLKNPEAVVAYKTDAVQYLSSASAMGNWDAMWFLSRSYQEGLLTEKNSQLAYAYKYAIQRSGGYATTIGSELGNLQRQMTKEEVTSAQKIGEQIVAQCCSRK